MGWFSRFDGTVGVLRIADARLASPRCPSAPRYLYGTHCSLPRWLRTASLGPGALVTRGPFAPLRLDGWRRLRFPGSLVALPLSPCSPTPIGPRRPHQNRTSRCCLLDVQSHRLLRRVITGLNHTARAFAVYASQWGSPPDHARLATDLLVRALATRDSHPLGNAAKFPDYIGFSFPFARASPGAMNAYLWVPWEGRKGHSHEFQTELPARAHRLFRALQLSTDPFWPTTGVLTAQNLAIAQR
jgi:hypothetical protein